MASPGPKRDEDMTGTLRRASAIMRLLATSGPRGAALTDLARTLSLPHPTVHRLLQQLIFERWVVQHEETRRYALGQLSFELGLAAEQQFDVRRLCRPTLERLALDAGDTVYLVIRSGNEAVCVDRHEGPSPIRVLTLAIGSRRPLGMGAGGLAILAALPPPEQQALVDEIAEDVQRRFGVERVALQESVQETRRLGYSRIRNRVTPGVTAVGRHVSDSLGRPFAAISIAAVHDRMDSQRTRQVAEQLAHCVRKIERQLRRVH
jgi:DNA-binding IclR family transcriptional regulator